MSEELAKPSENSLLAVAGEAAAMQKFDEKDFGLVASVGDWLPYLMIGTANSDPVNSGKLPLAHFAVISNKELTDFGKTVHCWALGWRPKAMDFTGDMPLSFFDPKSEIFNKIKTESFVANSSKMYGPEYLMYIPGYGFCTLFMGSKTARNEAKNIQAALPNPKEGKNAQPITLTGKFIDNGTYKWWAIVAAVSKQEIETPDPEEFKEQITKFLNPKDSAIPVAAPAAAKTEDRG